MKAKFIKEINETPFVVVQNEANQKFHLAIGDKLASKKGFTTEAEAEEEVKDYPWEEITNFIVMLVQKILENGRTNGITTNKSGKGNKLALKEKNSESTR